MTRGLIPILLPLGAMFSSCATKTPYARLNEIIDKQTSIQQEFKLQPIPEPFAFLAVGDVIIRANSEENRRGEVYVTNSFKVITSPLETITLYYYPPSPDISKCIVKNFEDGVGTVAEERRTIVLDGESVMSLGAGFGNAALKAKGQLLREKSQQVELEIPIRFMKPNEVALDSLLEEVQKGSFEPLKRGCTGEANDNNFVELRGKIARNLKQAATKYGSEGTLYIIGAIAWSQGLSARLVDSSRQEVSVAGDVELASIVTGAIGTPEANAEYQNESKTSVQIVRDRFYWGYRAIPLKVNDSGLLEVDPKGEVLMLSPMQREEKRSS